MSTYLLKATYPTWLYLPLSPFIYTYPSTYTYLIIATYLPFNFYLSFYTHSCICSRLLIFISTMLLRLHLPISLFFSTYPYSLIHVAVHLYLQMFLWLHLAISLLSRIHILLKYLDKFTPEIVCTNSGSVVT